MKTNASKDFNKAVIKSLKAKGIVIYSTTWLPDEKGSFANGQRGYMVNDNECSRILTYMSVVELAK